MTWHEVFRRLSASRVSPVVLLAAFSGVAHFSAFPCFPQVRHSLSVPCVAESPSAALDLPNAEKALTNKRRRTRSGPLILAFLKTIPDTTNSRSRTQAIILKSVAAQYAKLGLQIRFVDMSYFTLLSTPPDSDLINVPYDWHLPPEGFLVDKLRVSEKVYCVHQIPSVLLYDSTGKLIRRWDGLVSSLQLGISLHQLLGLSFDQPVPEQGP